jgi:hypothetical protein
MADSSFKFLESEEYLKQKEVIRKEINWGDRKQNYFPDRSVFKKTDKEKGELLTIKKKHRKLLQETYGKSWKKHLNIPEKEIGVIKIQN